MLYYWKYRPHGGAKRPTLSRPLWASSSSSTSSLSKKKSKRRKCAVFALGNNQFEKVTWPLNSRYKRGCKYIQVYVQLFYWHLSSLWRIVVVVIYPVYHPSSCCGCAIRVNLKKYISWIRDSWLKIIELGILVLTPQKEWNNVAYRTVIALHLHYGISERSVTSQWPRNQSNFQFFQLHVD